MFAANLRAARYAARLSQWKLSQRVGVAQSVIARLESGEIAFPQASTVRRLADALNMPVSALMDKTPVSEPDPKTEAVANLCHQDQDAFIRASRAIIQAKRIG
jgi:transcriptional regulator with XRE-family HTH domain